MLERLALSCRDNIDDTAIRASKEKTYGMPNNGNKGTAGDIVNTRKEVALIKLCIGSIFFAMRS